MSGDRPAKTVYALTMSKPRNAKTVVETYPRWAQDAHAELRKLLREQAEKADAGPLTETLKWGQPAYLTDDTNAGATVRIAWSEKRPDVIQVLVPCQTSLVEEWRQKFGDAFEFDGNRAIHLARGATIPQDLMAQCFTDALTYRRR